MAGRHRMSKKRKRRRFIIKSILTVIVLLIAIPIFVKIFKDDDDVVTPPDDTVIADNPQTPDAPDTPDNPPYVPDVPDTLDVPDMPNVPNNEYVPDDYTELEKYKPIDSPEYREAERVLTPLANAAGYKMSDYPAALVSLYVRNKDARPFVEHYFADRGQTHEIDLSGEVREGEIPLFMQWDERWGYVKYGSGIIGVSACGPVALSMVAVYLTGDTYYDPVMMSEFSVENGYYSPNNGTAWKLMSEGATKLGLVSKELALVEGFVSRELREGHPIICIMGEGDFTQSGHYIVLTGYEDGMVTVNDPNSYENSAKTWKFKDIESQIRNMWSFRI